MKEFLNERKLQIKRKYTENYPAIKVYENVPFRNKILSFVAKNKIVSLAELKNYIRTLSEEMGKSANISWYYKNKKYFDKTIDEENGEIYIKLSKYGERVYNNLNNIDEDNNDEYNEYDDEYNDEYESDYDEYYKYDNEEEY